ncbi:Nucleic acid-binding OB-fold [Arabidopsis thaliana x Arabidopsis arenosa]|uniref:Nucleic acid-binding OB-fold n=2 Tax=Arabidopsis TaxID=3701 RepID=A0A8T1XDK5_9BRAS|nr:Nucleic acid-binding OB-fold [Arabidopsis thaliana x Arabidopsis arenosa]
MAASFAFLRDIRPYKTSWRVQVKVLHSWRQYTNLTGETLELVVADAQGMKIHASIKKDLVSKYVNHLPVNEWRFIETFALSHASGQFRPTGHLYKMSFVTGTTVLRCDPVSDSSYLSLATFPNILNGDLNPYMLIDVMGQVVNIGELETLEANNKPTTKLDFELRDENDERLSCTLWGSFAQQVFNACDAADGARVICLIRFAKIKAYKGVRSISNSFDATQVLINPPIPEVAAFVTALPADGLALTFRESVPKFQMVTVAKDDSYLQYERKTISELLSSMEIGKVRVVCTIYGIDTDWAWYYFSCRNCNKKVTHIHSGVNSGSLKKPKPRFWCDVCKNAVTNVVAKYMLYAKVMDNTGETKCLLFDSICADIVGESAASVLGGSFNEIEDPEDLPDVVQNLIGKTFLFLLCVEKENIWDGKDCYKVSRVLSKHGLLGDEVPEDSDQVVNPASIVSGDQPLLLTMSQDTSDSVTPSSKRVYALNTSETDQASSSKKVCIQPVDLVKSSPEFSPEVESGKKDDGHGVGDLKDGVIKSEGVKIDDGVSINGLKVDVKPGNLIDATIQEGVYDWNFRPRLKVGNNVLMSENECSRLFIDPIFYELDIPNYLRSFEDGESDEDDLMIEMRPRWTLYVKILSIWNQGIDAFAEPTKMILADEKANMIDAFIPPGNYLYNFQNGLKEGQWYYMADFHVVPSVNPVKYAWNRFALECIWPTTMWPVSPRSNSNFFNFIHSDEVEYAGAQDKEHVTDAIGVISKVSAIQRFPFVCREGETDYESRYVHFEIKDDMGRVTNCVAVGRSCQLFVTKWFRHITSVTYNYDPVVIVLRLWRVSEFNGKNCLMSEYGCSRLFLDPTFPDFDIPRYMPYKTSWRVQVKVLHSWRQYTNLTGETLELVVADAQGMKIHASIKKDLVSKYVNHLPVNEWRFIETFALSHASGQFRPTGHLYKMSFVTGTTVLRCDPVSDSSYLSLATFPNILNGDLNPYMLIDVMGQVVNIGELETLEANNKPTTKLDFELRDENDERLSCTLWGSFAQQVFNACDAADGARVICLIRFAKIKAYKGVRSISNSFDATQVLINPPIPEVAAFVTALPADGLALTFRESVPKFQMVTVAKDDSYLQYERKTISELLSSMEIGKVRVVCTIYGIDTDWAWYYFSCRNCNKKVTHIHSGVNSGSLKKPKPRFWCDVCKNAVTNVVAKYMLYAKVMDNTGETKCLLFDSICADIVGESAASVLGGSFNEIEDPEDLPDVVQNLIGKTFLFLLCVEKENIWDGKDCYKVSRVLSKHGLLGDEVPEDSDQVVNPASIVSGDQPLLLTMSQDTSDSVTPSSKRVYALNTSETDQASSSKKVCIQPVDLVKSSPEFSPEIESGKKDDGHGVGDLKDGVIKSEGVKIDDGVSINGLKVDVKPGNLIDATIQEGVYDWNFRPRLKVGNNVLMSENECSRLFIDPIFYELDIPNYLRSFEDGESDEDDLMIEMRPRWTLYVKILSIWNQGIDAFAEPTKMILADEKANMIDAFIPPGNYLYNFQNGLKEGQWYYMADFHVVPSVNPVKYAWNRFALECIWPTTMWPVSPRSNSNFFNFIHSDEVEYAGAQDKEHVTDAIGVISKVSAIQRFPFVCREGETDYESRYVHFEIKDDMGRVTNCVAVGRSCQLFVTKWFRHITSVTYNYDPVVIVLRLWRVSEFNGKNCLMSEYGCSRLFLDPTFPDFDIPRYIRCWTEAQADKKDVAMELDQLN